MKKDDYMEFAKTLQRLMQEKGISAYRMAKKLGVHQTTISNWLNGKSSPRVTALPQIAEVLDVGMTELIERVTKNDK